MKRYCEICGGNKSLMLEAKKYCIRGMAGKWICMDCCLECVRFDFCEYWEEIKK